MTRVWYAAQRNHLTIPFPSRTLYHFHGPTTQAKQVSEKFTDSLNSLPAFVPLDKQQQKLKSPSQGIMLQHFATGEFVVRQGYTGNALYIIVSGQARVTTTNSLEQEVEVLILKAGEFFGEMALFSGEPSTVSVIALEDLEVLMIDAFVVNQMIDRQPSFAREISQILEIRRRTIQAVS